MLTTSSGKNVPLCLPKLASTWEIGVVRVKVVDEVGVLVKVVDEVEVLDEVVDVAMLALFVDTFKLVIVIFFGNAVTGHG